MGQYPIPYSQFTNTAYFYANNNFELGAFSKPVNSSMQVTVDYSKLSPSITPQRFYFLIDTGDNPLFLISAPMITGSTITFWVSQGVANTAYTVSVVATMSDTSTRTDYVVVNVFDDSNVPCGSGSCLPLTQPNLGMYLNTNSTVFINTAPQFSVSSVEPEGPNIFDMWWDTTTGILYQYITNGATSFWEELGGAGLNNNAPAVIRTPLYYVANAGQTVFNLSTTDLFGNSYTMINDDVDVYRSGGKLVPDNGTGTGGFTANFSTNSVTLAYPAGVGELVEIDYYAPPPVAKQLILEALTVISQNVLTPLSSLPSSPSIILFVNGMAFFSIGLNAAFTVSGQTITWTSTVWTLTPGTGIVCQYIV